MLCLAIITEEFSLFAQLRNDADSQDKIDAQILFAQNEFFVSKYFPNSYMHISQWGISWIRPFY